MTTKHLPDEVLDFKTAIRAALDGAVLISSHGRRIRITDRGIEVMDYNSAKWREAICPFSEGASYSVSAETPYE